MTKDVTLMVVGGAGSVGNRLVRALEPRPVIVVDRMTDPDISPNTRYLKCEVGDLRDVESLCDQCRKHLHVLYLVANLDSRNDSDCVASVLRDNVLAIGHFLSVFAGNIKHFTYLSSVSVYGHPVYNPIDEDHPIQPYSIYGASKASAEIVARVLCAQYHIPLTVIRATQLFGLSSAESTLPHVLLNQIQAGQLPKITCTPQVERDYLHVRDLINLLIRVVDSPAEGIFNAGSSNPIRIVDLFRLFFESFGKPFELDKVLQVPYQPSFTQVLSIAKAREKFSFSPSYSIQQWIADLAKDTAF